MINLLNNKFNIIFLFPFFLGSLIILSFAPYNLTFINFFSFSILLYLILLIKKKNFSKNCFFYLGCAFGFGFFLFGNYWITISLTHEDQFKVLIPFALFLIPLFLSLFFGLAIFILVPFVAQNIFFILLFSTTFSIFEFLRGNLFTGFPWNLISYTWSWSIEFIQILSVIGVYSFSLISITLFCIPFLFFRKKIIKINIFFTLFFLIIITGNYFYGSYKAGKNVYQFDKKIYLKIISPNLTLKEYSSINETSHLNYLIGLSKPEKNKKTIFIWPEGVFYKSYLQDIKQYQELFKTEFSENHLIILGINNFVSNKDEANSFKYFNSFVVLDNKLNVLSTYNKIKLVPFGEFLPFEKILSKLGLKKITRGYNAFSPGNERKIVNLSDKFNQKRILPLICYEIIYSGNIKTKKQFPDLAINISEDAWFGKSIGPYQHFDKAIYRSVEEGIFIARSANKGISAIISPNGEVLKSIDINKKGSLEYNLPSYFQKPTFFSKYGNKIFFLIIFLYILLTLILKNLKSNE